MAAAKRKLAIVAAVFGAMVLLSAVSQCEANAPKRVLLSSVSALTLRQGQFTTGRRSSPVPQTSCVGGNACSDYANLPKIIQCYNRGSDGKDIQWECKATLNNNMRFGETTVTCEGFEYPDDPYVLEGSCGVEYTLEATNTGYSNSGYTRFGSGYNSPYSSSYSSGSSFFGSLFSFLLLVGIVFVVIRTCFGTRGPIDPATGRAPGPNFWGGGGGWGGGGYPGGGYPGGGYPGGGPGCNPGPGSGSGNFWWGLAAGGLLGNLLSRPRGYGYGTGYRGGYGGMGGGYGGMGGGMGGGFGGSMGSSSASGFGGTRRR